MNTATNPALTVNTTETLPPNAFTRERRYAATDVGTHAILTVSRHDYGAACTVAWNVDQGRGWTKGWRVTRTTEAEALAFAAEKWITLIAWLEKTPSKDQGRDGASEAFSAQVAGMMR